MKLTSIYGALTKWQAQQEAEKVSLYSFFTDKQIAVWWGSKTFMRLYNLWAGLYTNGDINANNGNQTPEPRLLPTKHCGDHITYTCD